eukprot:41772-Amphidinium_carterae.1
MHGPCERFFPSFHAPRFSQGYRRRVIWPMCLHDIILGRGYPAARPWVTKADRSFEESLSGLFLSLDVDGDGEVEKEEMVQRLSGHSAYVSMCAAQAHHGSSCGQLTLVEWTNAELLRKLSSLLDRVPFRGYAL